MTPVQGAGLVDYRNRAESFQLKEKRRHEYGCIFLVA